MIGCVRGFVLVLTFILPFLLQNHHGYFWRYCMCVSDHHPAPKLSTSTTLQDHLTPLPPFGTHKQPTTTSHTHTKTHHDPSQLVHTSRQHVSSPNISARPITPHTQLSMTHTHPIQPHTTQRKSPRHIMDTQNTLSSTITTHHRVKLQT